MKFKILPGSFNQGNNFSSEIGWQGLLAFGNHNYVQIIDPKSGQLVQTLERHSQTVHMVKWAPENFYHDLKKSYSLKLASADISGMIIVWDATYATVLSDFFCQGKKVLDFHWMKHQEVSIDFIVALHTGGELILWNTDSGNRVWSKTYSEYLLDFSVDNHDFNNLAFRGDSFILLVSDFSLTRTPESNGRKFFICNAGESTPDMKSKSINRLVVSKSAQLIKATARLMMDFGTGSNENLKLANAPGQSTNNCIQVLYHSYCQNHIILVYPREILVMDLMIFQAVASITLDRSTSNFIKVYSCWQNDLLYCLHDNGIVTIRGRRPVVIYEDGEISSSQKLDIDDTNNYESPEDIDNHPILIKLSQTLPQCVETSSGLSPIFGWVEAGWYQLICQTEAPRLTRNLRVVGVAVSPVSEKTVCLITSDTRIQSWELQVSPVYLEVFPGTNSYLLAPQHFVRVPLGDLKQSVVAPKSLFHMIQPMVDFSAFIEYEKNASILGSFRVVSNDVSKVSSDSTENSRIEQWGKLTLIMSALHQGLLSDPTALKANPDNMNNSMYPLVAVGNSKGIIQLWNLSSSQLEREFQVMHCPIKGIEWIQAAVSQSNMGHIIVYGHNISSSQTASIQLKVKNYLSVIPLKIGRIIELRNDTQESPIEMVRVSALRQYFAVVLKDGPTEIWDCRSLIKLRDIPITNKLIISLEWSLGTSVSRNTSKMIDADGNPNYLKEKYLTIDTAGFMQHVIIEGTVLTKGRQVPVESTINKISTMGYKNNVVVIGNTDGSVLFWNFKNMTSVISSVNQGRVIKISFDHFSGAQNKLVAILSSEGLSMWDLKQAVLIKYIKWGKEVNNRILAIDWLDDGQTLVLLGPYDMRIVRSSALETSCSVVSFDEFSEPLTCLPILPPKILFALKNYLQHQPWKDTYCVSSGLWEKDGDILNNSILVKMLKQLHEKSDLKPFALADKATAKDLAIRCYLVANLIGDEYELKFWAVAITTFFPNYYQPYLPWEMVWSTEIFKTYQKSRLWSLDRKKSSYKQTQKCTEAFIMLGDLDRAVRLLLETSPSNSSYVSDLQLACLLANQSPSLDRQISDKGVLPAESGDSNTNAHHSTVKLVATQFISNNCLKEGVQLLCVINKQADACRYLETYNEWKTAIWLAKCTLSEGEVNEIERRWACNILQSQVATKSNALLQFLALGDCSKVIEILVMAHQYQLATRFVEFCQLLQIKLNDSSITRSKHVFSEFGKFLLSINCETAAQYYQERGENMCRAME